MTPIICGMASVVLIVLICRVCVTVERLKGVSQNAGEPEKYSGPSSTYIQPTIISDGMSQP